MRESLNMPSSSGDINKGLRVVMEERRLVGNAISEACWHHRFGALEARIFRIKNN